MTGAGGQNVYDDGDGDRVLDPARIQLVIDLLESRRRTMAALGPRFMDGYSLGVFNTLGEVLDLLGDPNSTERIMASPVYRRGIRPQDDSSQTIDGDDHHDAQVLDSLTEETNDEINADGGRSESMNVDGVNVPLIDLLEWPRFHPTRQRRDKWQSLKVLEEGSEVHSAAQDYRKALEADSPTSDGYRDVMLDEVADLLQTVANLLAAYDVSGEEMLEARDRNIGKNRDREMFEDGPRVRMHRDDE